MDDSHAYETTKSLREIGDLSVEAHREMSRILHLNDIDLRVMMYLMEHGPKSIGEIAEEFDISHPLATISANRIQAVGHSHRARDINDHRRVLIEPDPESITTAMNHIRPMIEATEEHFQSLPPEEKAVISSFLEFVAETMRAQVATLQATPPEPTRE